MNKKSKNAIIYISLAVIIVIIIAFPKLKTADKDEKPVARQMPVTSVSVKVIKNEKLDNKLNINASLLSNETAGIYSEIAGRIENIHFSEDSYVKKGQLLVKIDDKELKAQLNKAQARLELLEKNEARQKKLLEREGISKEAYDVALSELKMQKAEVELLETKIEKTNIRAPFAGKIGVRHFSKGAFVTTNDKISQIYSTNPIKLEFSIPQKYFSQVEKNEMIEFVIPPSEKKYTAKIYAMEPALDEDTRSLLIRAIADNPAGELIPGAYAEITLPVNEIDNAKMLPTQAVIQDIGGAKVFVFSNGKAVPKRVETGIRTADEVQIVEGIESGDTVICSGIIQLRPGSDVKISGECK